MATVRAMFASSFLAGTFFLTLMLPPSANSCPPDPTGSFGSDMWPEFGFTIEATIPGCLSLVMCATYFHISTKGHNLFWYDDSKKECHLGLIEITASPMDGGNLVKVYHKIEFDEDSLLVSPGEPMLSLNWTVALENGTLCQDHGLVDLPEELSVPKTVISERYQIYACGGSGNRDRANMTKRLITKHMF